MIHTTFHKLMVGARSEKGGALIYILIAIALLAALTTTFMGGGGQQSRTQNAFKLASELNSQARVIRSAIQDCVLRFPGGDEDIAEAGYFAPYPLTPTSTQFTSPATDRNVSRLGCPGTSAATGANPGSSDDHIALFGGGGQFASFLPPTPDLMEEWQYFNGNFAAAAGAPLYNMAFNGVFFQIASDRSDPFIGEAMQKIDETMSSCEVDYQVGDGTNGCENNHQCLRFWIIRNGSTGPTGAANATNGQNPCP
jgi:hypothetical protein